LQRLRFEPSAAALTIGQDDIESFERLLGDIQTAYGREDVDKLGAMTTPEMLSYFSQDLADNAKQGLRNVVSDVKLLQGDLSEAWRESGSDYATVAMRYSLIDATVDRAISGDRTRPPTQRSCGPSAATIAPRPTAGSFQPSSRLPSQDAWSMFVFSPVAPRSARGFSVAVAILWPRDGWRFEVVDLDGRRV
jgi:Tim44-like domain